MDSTAVISIAIIAVTASSNVARPLASIKTQLLPHTYPQKTLHSIADHFEPCSKESRYQTRSNHILPKSTTYQHPHQGFPPLTSIITCTALPINILDQSAV